MNEKTLLDSGFIYSPYIPMTVGATVYLDEFIGPIKKTPLQRLAEGVFEEEIESGDIKPIWSRKSDLDLFTKRPIRHDFYDTITIVNL